MLAGTTRCELLARPETQRKLPGSIRCRVSCPSAGSDSVSWSWEVGQRRIFLRALCDIQESEGTRGQRRKGSWGCCQVDREQLGHFRRLSRLILAALLPACRWFPGSPGRFPQAPALSPPQGCPGPCPQRTPLVNQKPSRRSSPFSGSTCPLI